MEEDIIIQKNIEETVVENNPQKEQLHCAICGATNKVLFTGPYGPTCEDCME